ncbi:MAG: hypothetical protein JWO83_2982 [Caulobacteraceae bacterium]|nr:hypothetical protein [Caulobacteraceae bacterium]
MAYRIVVTGHTTDGASTCLRDGLVEETPGWMFNFWGTPASPADNSPATDAVSPDLRLSPPPEGSLFRIFHIPPDRELAAMTQAELDEIARKIGGAGGSQPGQKLWHRTETVDYVIVLSGRVTLQLDIGDIELGPLDVVIQRGTHHAWSNKGDTVAVAACIMVGATPLGIVGPRPEAHRLALGG